MIAIQGDAMLREGRWATMLLMLSMLCCVQSGAQATMQRQPSVATETARGTELDSVVAVVNGDLILESDVDEERRLMAFQPFHDSRSKFQREEAIQRLIDRMLILQQVKLQPEEPITDKAVEEQLSVLRKDIPACKLYLCETDGGWQRFVTDQGFTMDELHDRWRQRMDVLRFIEVRFRMGIRISDEEMKTYYDKTLVPQYERQKATAPKFETISDRIQEILLQQQVGALLKDWLTTLRAQGSVRMMTRGEVAP